MSATSAYGLAVAQLPLGFVRKAPRDEASGPDARGTAAAESASSKSAKAPSARPESLPDEGPSGAAPSPDAERARRPQRTVYTVSELCGALDDTLRKNHPQFWVEGEISGLRVHQGSGHLYFDLKDDRGKIPCVVWSSNRPRIKFELRDGTSVLCHAKPSIFARTGRLSLSVFFMEPRGLGALFAEFEARRDRLRAEGLTDPARKRALPGFPSTVGVVTSESGAALHDVLRTLWRRHPGLRVVLATAPVQGRSAAPRIVSALRRLDTSKRCDVIILARGGGSLEDLWAFNEEAVARAIVACETPVVTGIGHETDTTIADLVADQRASTPTAAAEAVAPVRAEWAAAMRRVEARLTRAMTATLRARSAQLRSLEHRLRHPAERHRALRAELATLTHRLERALEQRVDRARGELTDLDRRLQRQHPRLRIERARSRLSRSSDRLDRAARRHPEGAGHRLTNLLARLEAHSPVAVLARGYAFVTDDAGRVVKRASQVAPGDAIDVRLAEGRLEAVVRHAHPPSNEPDHE